MMMRTLYRCRIIRWTNVDFKRIVRPRANFRCTCDAIERIISGIRGADGNHIAYGNPNNGTVVTY
jgi:hypothetical protein